MFSLFIIDQPVIYILKSLIWGFLFSIFKFYDQFYCYFAFIVSPIFFCFVLFNLLLFSLSEC